MPVAQLPAFSFSEMSDSIQRSYDYMDMRKSAMESSKEVTVDVLDCNWIVDRVEMNGSDYNVITGMLWEVDELCKTVVDTPTVASVIEFQCGG